MEDAPADDAASAKATPSNTESAASFVTEDSKKNKSETSGKLKKTKNKKKNRRR